MTKFFICLPANSYFLMSWRSQFFKDEFWYNTKIHLYIIAKKELKKIKNEGTLFRKLQSVMLSYEHGIKETANFLGVFPVSIRNWAKLINKGDINSLKIGSKHKEGIKIKNHHKKEIEGWINNNPNITGQEVVQMLKDKFDLQISLSTARRAMKSVGLTRLSF